MGDSPREVFTDVQRNMLPDVSAVMYSKAPNALRVASKRGLGLDLTERYQKASEMARDLSRAMHDIDSTHTTPGLARLLQTLDSQREERSVKFKAYADLHTENVLASNANGQAATGADATMISSLAGTSQTSIGDTSDRTLMINEKDLR